ncbi:MAG: hypothetical protein PHX34_03955 [Candidatus Shapirobacteria bacterium]|jgi:hypothetical protein|nr:hypothetical protein [Candidatus Shapirobacteria bacterium]
MATKKRKKKKDNKVKKGNVVLDTSFQIERIKFPEDFERNLDNLLNDNKIYCSSYSLYEFKTSFIFSLIDFYFKVELHGPSKAFAIWSDKWGYDPKYGLLFSSVMCRENKILSPGETKNYLDQVESSIIVCLEIFDNKITGICGSFSSDFITSFQINGREDFASFRDAYLSREIIPMLDFWSKKPNELLKLVESKEFEKKYPKLHGRLKKINEDVSNSEKKRINHGVGDPIIAIDCPENSELITTDKSFDIICPVLGKEHQKYEKVKLN